MELLISLLIVLIISLIFSKQFKRYNLNFYLGAIIIGIIILLSPSVLNIKLINQRYLGLACIIIVMYTGVLNSKWKITKKLKSIRADLAIIGFILVSFHAWKHLFTDFRYLWLAGLITYIMMIPLIITSFKKIKFKLGQKKWIRIHKFSYLIYLLLYIHLFLASDGLDKIIYSILFGVYYILKLIKYIYNRRR